MLDWQVSGLRFQYVKDGERGNTKKMEAEEKRKEEKNRIMYPILFQNESGIKTFLLVEH